VLERLAAEFGGAFELGKVDSDKEQDLAYAFGVQGIPFCVLVDGGRPVDAFQGALPEAEVRRFLQKNGIEPMVLEQPKAEVPKVDPQSPAGRLERARAAAAAMDTLAVREVLAGFPEEDERFDAAQRLLTGIEWLEADLATAKSPAEKSLVTARQALARKDLDSAMTQLIESVAADKSARAGLARKGMLLCFALVGEDDERLDDYRRRLATLLY
jgi:putative thioredoxin